MGVVARFTEHKDASLWHDPRADTYTLGTGPSAIVLGGAEVRVEAEREALDHPMDSAHTHRCRAARRLAMRRAVAS